jgi:hypothetical protein
MTVVILFALIIAIVVAGLATLTPLQPVALRLLAASLALAELALLLRFHPW